jgi:hypothetical protein
MASPFEADAAPPVKRGAEVLRPIEESFDASPGGALLAESIQIRQEMAAGPRRTACEIALSEYQNPSSDIFKVKSGEFAGYNVPPTLRCAIFQSNVAVRDGLIKPSEVTIRALEFGALVQSKGYRAQPFSMAQKYPDGTYIVGNGGNGNNEGRHVAMVCNGRLIHTRNGRIVNEPISAKFGPGSYDSITAYIPPNRRRAVADAAINDQIKI